MRREKPESGLALTHRPVGDPTHRCVMKAQMAGDFRERVCMADMRVQYRRVALSPVPGGASRSPPSAPRAWLRRPPRSAADRRTRGGRS